MEFFYDLPVWFPTAVLGIGLAVWVYGNNRTQPKLRMAGLGIGLLAVVLVVLSVMVDTPREASEKRTNAIVAAANVKAWDEFQSHFDSNTRLIGLTGAEAIRQRAEQYWGNFDFKGATVLGMSSTQAGSLITVEATIYADFAGPPTSTWAFEYKQRADAITLDNIRLIAITGGVAVDEVNRRLQ